VIKMVFGLEHIGQLANWFYQVFTNWGLAITVVITFAVFVLLNILFIWGYVKIFTLLPQLISRIRYLMAWLDDLLD